jgi:amidophosphoribosyltransferase
MKLNAIRREFEGKNVLLIDDSIVRGTTSKEIIQMAKDAGAKKVYFASAAPPVRFSNVYGVDIPTRAELIAHGRDEDEITEALGADQVIYNLLPDVVEAVTSLNPSVLKNGFDASCFDGYYLTGVTEEYLQGLEASRGKHRVGADAKGTMKPPKSPSKKGSPDQVGIS